MIYSYPKICVPNLSLLPFKVDQLIDTNLRCWKPNLINELFGPSSAQATLSIPIPSRPTADKLIWVLNL